MDAARRSGGWGGGWGRECGAWEVVMRVGV
jgi:hypothetical protein